MVKKVVKRKPKQKQKQKQKQQQNVIVNITNPKQQKEEKGYLPMMPSFNIPPPQQSSLGDITKLLSFISSRNATESKLGVSIPVVKPTEPIKENNFPLESNVNDSTLGEAVNNNVNEERSIPTPKTIRLNMKELREKYFILTGQNVSKKVRKAELEEMIQRLEE